MTRGWWPLRTRFSATRTTQCATPLTSGGNDSVMIAILMPSSSPMWCWDSATTPLRKDELSMTINDWPGPADMFARTIALGHRTLSRKISRAAGVVALRGQYKRFPEPRGCPAFRARPGADPGRRHRGPGASRDDRARPGDRAARLHPVLGGRASRHAGHRQFVAAGADRAH